MREGESESFERSECDPFSASKPVPTLQQRNLKNSNLIIFLSCLKCPQGLRITLSTPSLTQPVGKALPPLPPRPPRAPAAWFRLQSGSVLCTSPSCPHTGFSSACPASLLLRTLLTLQILSLPRGHRHVSLDQLSVL